MHRHLDLPKGHLHEGITFYQMPPIRDPEEFKQYEKIADVDERLIKYKRQDRGLKMAKRLLVAVHDPESIQFVRQITAEALINSAWHTAAQSAKEMRKVLDLPEPVALANAHRADGVELFQRGQVQLSSAQVHASHLVNASMETKVLEISETSARRFGRLAGSAALHLTSTTLADSILDSIDIDCNQASVLTRDSGLALLASSRERHVQTGTAPTIAQFTRRNSGVSRYFEAEAPDEAYQALDRIQEEFNIAA